MTTMGWREQAEREVLATLILQANSFSRLPEGFRSDVFELPEYGHLFESIATNPCTEEKLRESFPDQEAVIDNVVFGAIPLEAGKLKRQCLVLMNHRPPPELRDESQHYAGGNDWTRTREGFRFEILNGKQIAEMEIPKKSYLIENLITETSVNFLSGEEGCGKSLLAMNLAVSVAVGASKWLKYDIAKHGRVLFLNNELAFPDVARRLKTMSTRLPAPGDLSNLIVPREVPPMSECWETLNQTCKELQPVLIILDCLYFAHDEDENDSSKMKVLMRKFLALRDSFGLAVLIIHHTKKGTRYSRMHNDQMRGSNVFGASPDTNLQIRRSAADESKRILKPTKFRHVGDEERKCRLLSLDRETLWFQDEGEADEDEHIEQPGPTAEERIDFAEIIKPGEVISRKEVVLRSSPLGYDERTIDRLLKRAKAAKQLKSPRYGYYAL